MSIVKAIYNLIQGRAIIISKITDSQCSCIVGKNIEKRFAKSMLATTLQSLLIL